MLNLDDKKVIKKAKTEGNPETKQEITPDVVIPSDVFHPTEKDSSPNIIGQFPQNEQEEEALKQQAGQYQQEAKEQQPEKVPEQPAQPSAPAQPSWKSLNDMYDDLVAQNAASEKEREAYLKRHQKASDLANAIRVGLGGLGNALGGYTTKMEEDAMTPFTRQTLERLKDRRDITDHQLRLEKLRSAIRQSLQDERLKYLNKKQAEDMALQSWLHSPDYLKMKAKIEAETALALTKAKSKYEMDKIREQNAARLRELQQQGLNMQNAIRAKEEVKAEKKPYLTVKDTLGHEHIYKSKEDVVNEAQEWISQARLDAKKGTLNPFEMPKFLQDLIESGAPLSDSKAKELVKWIYQPKLGGITPQEDVVYPYEKQKTSSGTNVPGLFK